MNRRTLTLAAAGMLALLATSGTARADWDGHRHWGGGGRPPYGYYPPGYYPRPPIWVPPPVYYAPRPYYYAPRYYAPPPRTYFYFGF